MPIRERTEADLPSCVAALRSVHEATGDPVSYPTAWPADPGGWLTPFGLVRCWVAERDGAIVGHVGALAGSAEPGLGAATGIPVEQLALVTRLFVPPAARGLGLARELVRTVIEYGTGAGLRIGLDVMEESRAAIALYESLGWQFLGCERARWTALTGINPMIRYYLSPV